MSADGYAGCQDRVGESQRQSAAVVGRGKTTPFQVPGDFRVAHQVLRRVADRIDDDAGPKAGSVLAYPPALALELAFARRRRQGFRRQSRLPVFLGVEPREVLTEDFSLSYPLKRRAPGFQLVTTPLTSSM
jgi:hypothetical protein